MKAACLVVCALALGCGGDGAGDGDDTLPKRGEKASDPTIVAAQARCEDVVSTPGGPPPRRDLVVIVTASDPMGQANLGNCAVMQGDIVDQDSFGSGSAGTCFTSLALAASCAPNTEYTVDITVSNNTAGVTTASVKVRTEAD